MRKYVSIMNCELKNTFAYRDDTWLTAFFSIFSVALAYLLWSAVFGGAESVNGFTLTQMTTYYLLSGMLSPLTQSDGLLHDFSAEIKGGGYAKYMVKPLSPLGYFLSAGFARTLFPLLASTAVLSVAMISFSRYFEAIQPNHVLQALPVILLGAMLSMLIRHIIAMATFTFTEVEFIYILQNVIQSFLAGVLIPLDMVFGNGFPCGHHSLTLFIIPCCCAWANPGYHRLQLFAFYPSG